MLQEFLQIFCETVDIRKHLCDLGNILRCQKKEIHAAVLGAFFQKYVN